MSGLFGIWDWSKRQPSAGERTLAAVLILIVALASTAGLAIGVSRIMHVLLPTH